MSIKPSLPKGTRDFSPLQVQRRKYILNTIETVFKRHGFMPIETPTMENLSTLTGKYGDEGDQLIFKILNSGNYLSGINLSEWDQLVSDFKEQGDNLSAKIITEELAKARSGQFSILISNKALRYDLTVPFARYVVMNRNEITFPFKRYQMQPVWRADRPQKGRYREFWQCDADVIGSDSLLNEIDLIQIYHEAFTQLGVSYELKVNNRKILAGIAQVVKGIEHMNTIAVGIDKLDKIGEDGVRKELAEKGFSEAELNKLFTLLNANMSQLKNELANAEDGLKGIEEHEFVLRNVGKINIKTDYSLARGLSYYTGCIFEVVATQGTLKSSIGGGGRYDNLTGIFGLPNVSGVGISFGLDRIYDVMEELNLFPENINITDTKVLFCYFDEASQTYALQAVNKVREVGIAAEIYPDVTKKIGKQLDYANALHIPFAVIIGENEMQSGKLVCKNLNEGTQEELTLEEIIAKLHQ